MPRSSNTHKSPKKSKSKYSKKELEIAKFLASAKKTIVKRDKVRKSKKFNSSQKPNAPSGWEGPFPGFVKKTAVDPKTGKTIIKAFHDFDEAVQVANRVGAGGITRTPMGFKLRKENKVFNNATSTSKKEVSWLKSRSRRSSSKSPKRKSSN
jgi:hypothetical protein